MRTKDILSSFSDITLLLQYLYMDEDNFILVKNQVTTLKLRMCEDLSVKCSNLNYPELDEMDWTDNMNPPKIFTIVEQLKDSPAQYFPERFDSRWAEIVELTRANLAINAKGFYNGV